VNNIKSNLDNLRSHVFRGAIILDFINHMQIICDSRTNILNLTEDFVDVPEDEIKLLVMNNQATKHAFLKIITFMEESFGTEDIPKEQFRKKLFKGYKLVQTIKFIDFNIKDCESSISMFEQTSPYNASDFITYFDVQADCYSEIAYQFHKTFFKNIKYEYPTLHLWLKRYIQEGYFNGKTI